MAAGLGSVQAAEKIRWEDLQKRVLGELRSVNVITRDGYKYHSQKLEFGPDLVALYADGQIVNTVRRQDVERIEIRRRKNYSRHVLENIVRPLGLPILGALLPLVDPEPRNRAGRIVAHIGTASASAVGFAAGALLAPPFFAYGVASTPVFLVADGVYLLMPAKEFEVVP
jgi:hypothetical protein